MKILKRVFSELWFSFLCLFFIINNVFANSSWQQQIDYSIKTRLNDTVHQLTGNEQIIYSNNSPDTLKQIFIHLYWNAFQPNSSMDIRSKSIKDPDPRVGNRISNLSKEEMGSQKIKKIIIDNEEVGFEECETILKINLTNFFLPNTKHQIFIEFEAQIPIQIRRSGRYNKESIAYSMAQWYPKICAYDERGWHPNPYIAREFYGEWGDFDVQISLPQKYIVASTGMVIKETLEKNNYKTIYLNAPMVHDFVWVADTNFTHTSRNVPNEDLIVHFYYKPQNEKDLKKWQDLEEKTIQAYPIIKNKLGAYPYKQYSFIQGGDGGMEYPMATLIKNNSVPTALHEWIHSWFQGMLANNESDYGWLDEGFTNYYEHIIHAQLNHKSDSTLEGEYKYYNKNIKNDEEPMNTHSDHFKTNANYLVGSYTKGALLLQQLGYIVGDSIKDQIIKTYIHQWKFKHPAPNDFFKIAEDVSRIQLKWFQNYWVNSTKKIDYAIIKYEQDDNSKKDKIYIEKTGDHIMPIDVLIEYEDSSKQTYTIPLDVMFGAKKETNMIVLPAWKWVEKTYIVTLQQKEKPIKKIYLDYFNKMADINRNNHIWEVKK